MLKRLNRFLAPFFAFFGYVGDLAVEVAVDDVGSVPSEPAPPDDAALEAFDGPFGTRHRPVTSGYLQLDAPTKTIVNDGFEATFSGVQAASPAAVDAKAYLGRGCKNANGRAKKAYATKADADKKASKYPGMKSYRCAKHGWHVAHELSRGLRKAVRSAAHTKKARKKN